MLEAILGDLLTERIGNSEWLEANPHQSHFGFPSEAEPAGFAHYCAAKLPEVDPDDIFGFTWSIRNHLDARAMKATLAQLAALGHATRAEHSQQMSAKTSLGVSAARSCLHTPAESEPAVKGLLRDQDSIVGLFVQIQRLLTSSSLD